MRAFIIGNGVSLRETPLHLLNGETTFAMNRIHKIYPDTSWRPTYYLLTDIQNLDPEEGLSGEDAWVHDALVHIESGERCFFWGLLAAVLENHRKPYDIQDQNVTYIKLCQEHIVMDADSEGKPEGWHLPMLCKFGTGLAVAMQIAVQMKFDPLHLVGCDIGYKARGSYNEPDPNHFCDDYGSRDSMTEEEADLRNRTLIYAHRMAKSDCDERGITVYNSTIGGELEVYPRYDLMEVLNGD